MKNLFLIDGATGTGKSDLLEYVVDYKDDIGLVPKYSTREKREYEESPDWNLDLRFVTATEFDGLNLDYVYTYGGERYGFYREGLTDLLKKFSNVFVIVRSADVIGRLRNEFHFINVVPVYVYSDLVEVKKRLRRQHLSEEQIRFRVSRQTRAFADYSLHPEVYKDVLINNSSSDDFHRLIDHTLKKYSGEPEVDENLVFLLMSFQDKEHKALADYAAAIKRAVKSHDSDLVCKNLEDVKKGDFGISAEAKSQIRRSRLAIVDLTDNRPNVYYELGFVHGIDKDCILTCHRDTKPHFHSAYRHILFYSNAVELEMGMTDELVGMLKRF